MKKTILSFLLLICPFFHQAPAAPVEISAGLVDIRHHGVRHFGARSLYAVNGYPYVHSDQSVWGRVGMRFGKNWSTGVSFYDHGEVTFTDVSPDSDIFGRMEVALQVLTPYRIEQELEELAWDIRYRFQLTQRFQIEVGSTLSCYRWDSLVAGIRFEDRDTRFGGFAGASFQLSEEWLIESSFRVAQATEVDFEYLSLGIGYRF